MSKLDDNISDNNNLKTDLENGLTGDEVKKRQLKFGYNEIEEEKRNTIKNILKKFWGVTPWMLEITMVFSFIINKDLDGYIIGALLILNAIIGFTQEERASKAVDILKQKLQINAKVLRDSKWEMVPAKELVPGDIVRVRAGDFVPADLRILSGEELEVDQSALTGESMPVTRKAGELLYSGSIIRRNEATTIVDKTGKNTYFGKTTELVQFARPKLHIESIITRIVEYLLLTVVVLIGIMFVVTYLRGLSLISIIPLALILIVFAVPVALPAMFTVTMSFGSLEISKKGGLLTRLSAIEDAASMDILCADKTGTLTENRLHLTDIIPSGKYSEEDVSKFGYLASQEANQDPIDMAFINYVKNKNIDIKDNKISKFYPFDPSTRRTEAIVEKDGKRFKVTKGAVNTICQLCNVSLDENISENMKRFAEKGYRTLAVAVSNDVDEKAPYEFCGLTFLYDAPRSDTPALIEKLKEKGISVKMLTGDAEPIAREIARKVGLSDNIVPVSELKKLRESSPQEATEIAEKSSGFAEIYPEDKYVIVKSLQANKHIIGMTGDGINDAPSLKQAEVGIAVNSATDVAKAAASVVLTNEGLSNIVDVVTTGRSVYQRIVTWVLNKIVKTFEIAVFVSLAFIIFNIYALSALDVVLFLFLIDFVTISISTDYERGSENPEKWNISSLVKLSIGLGVCTVSELFLLLFIGKIYFNIFSDIRVLHTFYFTEILFFGLLTPLILRERNRFWKSKPSKTLLIAIIVDIIIVFILAAFGFGIIHAISPVEILFLLIYGIICVFLVNDSIKILLG
ncbi:MAG: plasma-membrane proton-efflux P-type ATPase, partial [Thermoplasmata archaeon]